MRNPKLHEESEYKRKKAGYYEAGKWSFFLHLLVAPIVAKYGFGKIREPRYEKTFIKELKEALSRVKVTDVKAYLYKARFQPERVDHLKDGFLLPPLEEVLQDPKKRKELVSWLRVALRDVGVRTYHEEIDKMIDRVYPLAVKMLDKFLSRWGDFDRWGNPVTTVTKEEVKKWEEFEEYLKILEEFAGLKLNSPEPPISENVTHLVKRTRNEDRTIGMSPSVVSPMLTETELEVLSILQALEFADYSESAKEKALGKLTSMLEELSKEELTPESLQKIGLIAFAVEIIKRGDFNRAEEIKRL